MPLLDRLGPLEFFAALENEATGVAYAHCEEGVMIAWNPKDSMLSTNENALDALGDFVKRQGLDALSEKKNQEEGCILGAISYDTCRSKSNVRSRHPATNKTGAIFHSYSSYVIWENGEAWLIGNGNADDLVEIANRTITKNEIISIDWSSDTSFSEYQSMFDAVQSNIRDGNYYQLNLTVRFSGETTGNPRIIFQQLLQRHPAPRALYIEGESQAIISVSPETFFTLKGGKIVTKPIKGTRPRSKDPLTDARQRDELKTSQKECAELSMITDLLRNDLSMVCLAGSVIVDEPGVCIATPSVWHRASTISGTVRPDRNRIDVLSALVPGGSITGCPKQSAMESIDEIEASPRGFYTGCGLIIRPSSLEVSILIRTIEYSQRLCTLGVGGGIVYDANAHDEYAEIYHKAAPFLALQDRGLRGYANGKRLHKEDPRMVLLDARNPFITGAFETMIAVDDVIRDLEPHLARLKQSLERTHTPRIHSMEMYTNELLLALQHDHRSARRKRVKIVVTPNELIVGIQLLPEEHAVELLRCMSIRGERRIPQAKALPYDIETSAHRTAEQNGYDEAILVDRDGYVTEAAYGNIFWVRDGQLYTRDDAVLGGITRSTTCDIAQNRGIPLHYDRLSIDELVKCDEVFLTKSTTGISPIIQINTFVIGRGEIGAITEMLIEKYEERYST